MDSNLSHKFTVGFRSTITIITVKILGLVDGSCSTLLQKLELFKILATKLNSAWQDELFLSYIGMFEISFHLFSNRISEKTFGRTVVSWASATSPLSSLFKSTISDPQSDSSSSRKRIFFN